MSNCPNCFSPKGHRWGCYLSSRVSHKGSDTIRVPRYLSRSPADLVAMWLVGQHRKLAFIRLHC